MKWISGLKPRFENQVQTKKWKTWKWKAEFQVYFKKSNVCLRFPNVIANEKLTIYEMLQDKVTRQQLQGYEAACSLKIQFQILGKSNELSCTVVIK